MELLQIVKNIDIYNTVNPAQKQDLFFKYLPLLSPIIVIATFFFNNWYNVVTKRKESKRNWYFKAYFEPSLKKVEEFFTAADNEVKSALELYQVSSTWKEDARIEFIGECLLKLADLKRRFSIEVLSVLQSPYPKEFAKLEIILNNFEDAGSDAFTSPPIEDAYFIYLSKINKIKGEIINTLSGPALH